MPFEKHRRLVYRKICLLFVLLRYWDKCMMIFALIYFNKQCMVGYFLFGWVIEILLESI